MTNTKIEQKNLSSINIQLHETLVLLIQGVQENATSIEKESIPTIIAILDPERDKMIQELEESLSQLLWAVTSKGATDTNSPIVWSGSPVQNRAMFKAIEDARKCLNTKQP